MSIRPNTKMAECAEIYNRLNGDRRQCIEAFLAVHDSKRTAETYYNLCFVADQESQTEQSDKVRRSTAKRKFSSIKVKPGTSQAAHVQMFLSKKAAEDYNNDHFGFTEVVPGEQVVGKKVGTVHRIAA